MKKPSCYLWKDDFTKEEELYALQETLAGLGFRVITFVNGTLDIYEGIRPILQSHSTEETS